MIFPGPPHAPRRAIGPSCNLLSPTANHPPPSGATFVVRYASFRGKPHGNGIEGGSPP